MKERAKRAWPEWTIGECIGKGGFGAVYKISRDVFGDSEEKALKVISIPFDEAEIRYMKAEGMDDISIAQTLFEQVGEIVREYKLMQKLQGCPNIVHTDDFKYIQHSSDPGWDIFIRMELLTPIMDALQYISSERAVIELGMSMCNALLICEKHNVIHRDIKPQNIFISPEGHYKLGDFGIARTVEHSVGLTAGVGTYNFMAPEVALGKHYNATADIYSLGLVLYWLLNEHRGPFMPLPSNVPSPRDNETARERRYRGDQIPAPKHGSDALHAIVMKACAYDPSERYQSASEMMVELRTIMAGCTKKNSAFDSGTKPEEEATVRESSGRPSDRGRRQLPEATTGKESVSGRRKGTYIQKKAKKKPKWPIALAAVAVIVAIGAGAFIGGGGKDDASASIQETEDAAPATETFDAITVSTEPQQVTAATTEPIITVPETVFDLVEPEDPQRDILFIDFAEEAGNHPDTFMLLSYERGDYTLSMSSILKDAYVSVPDYKGHQFSDIKLEYVYGLGKGLNGEQGAKELVAACLKENFGIEVDEIILTEDLALKTFVDAIGGVEVWVSMEDVSYISLLLMGNEDVEMDGDTAVRYGGKLYYDQSAVHRAGCQRNLLTSIIEKCKDLPANEVLAAIEAAYPYLSTEFTAEEILSQLLEVHYYKIKEAAYPAEGTYREEVIDITGNGDMETVLKFRDEDVQIAAETSETESVQQTVGLGIIVNTESGVNVRTGAGTEYPAAGKYLPNTTIEILETTTVDGTLWGRTDNGWISMVYVELVDDSDVGLNSAAKMQYTGKIINSPHLNVRANPSTQAELVGSVSQGTNITIYETVIAENMAWGRCDMGWVYLYYVDLTPVDSEFRDARIIYNDNTIVYSDIECTEVLGTYAKMTVVNIKEYNGKLAKTDLGWVFTDNLM